MIHRFSDSESEASVDRQPRGVLGMLFRHRVPILVGLGVLLVAAIALVVILPRQFHSSLDILVRNKLPLSARLSSTSQETVDEQRMQSELALLHSPELAAKVVDPDSPTQPDATHSSADIGRHQAAVALFSQQLVTSVVPGSNVIHVVVIAADPHRAVELASRLLEVFFASQSEVDHPTAATAFFISDANRAKDEWQQTQLALDTFRLAHPPAPVGSTAEVSLQIAALNHQIQRNDEQIDASIGRILTGERKLVTIPAHPLDRTNKSRSRSASMPLLSSAQLNAMLAIYTDEQAILLSRPPTDAEAVRASLSLASQIADTNASLQLARQSTTPERDPAANSLWQSTTEEITQAGVELKALYATRVSLATQLAGFQTTLDSIQHPPATLASLQSKAASLQAAYRLAEQRANEARIADAMDQQLRLNVAVASRPSFSNTATSPSPWLYAATIALAVIFLAACLILFAGMYSNEYDAHARAEDEDDEEYEDEDSSEQHYDHDYDQGYEHEFVSGQEEQDSQQELEFPSRIRSSQSGAFLYAAPGSSMPHPRSAPKPDAPIFPSNFPDPLFEPIAQAPMLSEILSQPSDPIDPVAPEVAGEMEEAVETHPSPPAEIFHPNQYQSAATPSESTAEEASGFDPPPDFARSASGTSHAVVPSFFAGPRSGTFVQEEVHEPQTNYDFYDEPAVVTPVVAAPFGGAPLVEAASAAPQPEAAAILSAIPAREPEPIVTLPDPTPPWSQSTPEPKPSPLPPLSYWASVYDASSSAASTPESTEPKAPETVSAEPTQAAPVQVQVEPLPAEPVQPQPLYAEPVYVSPPAPVTREVYAAPLPVVPEPIAPVGVVSVEPKALTQTFTSTLRHDPFLASVSSTLSAPAFRFSAPPVRPPAPPAPPHVTFTPAAEPVAPPVLTPDPELVVSYDSHPIELVPDPVMPPVKLPYKVPQRETAQASTPEPVHPPASTAYIPNDLSDFPLYRAPKAAPLPGTGPSAPSPAAPPIPASPSVRAPGRPQTYEEMVRALVFPEEFAPYVPPARPTGSGLRAAAEFVSEPRPLVPAAISQPIPAAAPPVAAIAPDDDAPPFHYARKSPPATPPATAPVYAAAPQQESPETIQNFIRRPSVPLQPGPGQRTTVERDDRTVYRAAEPAQRDDRTTYHAVAAVPPQAVPLPREPWIDIAPAPVPRGEGLDPQKRPPDRISAIRESGSRTFPVTDRSGVRLTPSQRMKLGRPTTNQDKDGNVTYTDYLSDKDKHRT